MPAVPSLNNSKVARSVVILIGILIIVPFSSGILSYYQRFGSLGMGAKAYLLGMCAPAACVALFFRPRLTPSIIALLTLQVLRLIEAFFHTPSSAVAAEEMNIVPVQVGCLIFTVSVFCLVGDISLLRKICLICAGLTIIACTASNMWQWHDPDCLVKQTPGRSAGWLWDSNLSADAIVIMMGLFLALSPSATLSALAVAVAVPGLWCTLSRSGSILFIATLLTYFFIFGRHKVRQILVFGIVAIGMGVVLFSYFDFDYHPEQNAFLAKRDEGRKDVLLGKGLSEMDLNDTDHLTVLKEAIAGVKANPILGYGTGSSFGDPFLPHNELIAVWLDNGILGMLLYVLAMGLLIYECVKKLPRMLVACVPMVVLIPFSHSTLEDRFYTFSWIAIIGICQVGHRFAPKAATTGPGSSPASPRPIASKVEHFFQPSGDRAVGSPLAKPETKP